MMDSYEGLTDEEILCRAEEFIAAGNLHGAKEALNAVKQKSARKYFVESKFYKSKGWYNEAKKCLNRALKAEPYNEEYKKALEDLEAFRKCNEYIELREQMGGKDLLAECCCECSCEACAVGLCEGICDGL